MPAHVRDGGSARLVQRIVVRVGGVDREITEGWVREGGTARQFFGGGGGLSVGVDFTSRLGNRIGAGNVTTNIVTATGSPGGGTYSWRRTGGDSRAYATAASSAATAFRIDGMSPYEEVQATFVCDYTNGTTVTSTTVTATFICDF